MYNEDNKSFGDGSCTSSDNSILGTVKVEQEKAENAQPEEMTGYDSILSSFGETVKSREIKGDTNSNEITKEVTHRKDITNTSEEMTGETGIADTAVNQQADQILEGKTELSDAAEEAVREAEQISEELVGETWATAKEAQQTENNVNSQIAQPDPFEKLYRNNEPTYYVAANAKPKNNKVKKHRSTGSRAALFGLIIILLLSTLVLITEYDFSFSVQSDGLDISMRDKDSYYYGDDWDSDSVPPDYWSEDGTYYGSGTTQMTVYPTADGTTMTISQSQGEPVSLQDVYSKCIDSIVSVNVGLDGGYATGTGIIMSSNGYIITNDHVVDGATDISIELQDGTEYEAVLIGRDSQTDVAVLKIEASDLKCAEFGDSTKLRVGDEVAAIGNPMGLNSTLSNGIISALDRDVDVNGYYMTMIQTNAAINEGNSGGALINMYGQVIGITNMKLVSYSYSSSIEGLAFAIPTSVVKPVVDSLIEHGYVGGRPALGITCRALEEAEANSEDLPAGVYILSIYEGSDAYGKLQEGDVITAANGTEVKSNEELNEIKNTLSVGDILTLTIYRDGETLDVDILLVESSQLNG